MTECLPDLPRHVRQRGNEWQGADNPDGPWHPIPAPQSGLPWKTDGPAVQSREPASVAFDARPLSPAAQAVETAVLRVASAPGLERRRIIAAAAAVLRVAVEQLVPEPPDCGTPWSERVGGAEDRQRLVRFRMLAIAAELEGSNG